MFSWSSSLKITKKRPTFEGIIQYVDDHLTKFTIYYKIKIRLTRSKLGEILIPSRTLKKCIKSLYVMFCAIWCHFYNLKNVKNIIGGVRSVTFSKVTLIHRCFFFNFLKLYKWYQIAQCITYVTFLLKNSRCPGFKTDACAFVKYKINLTLLKGLRHS